MSSSATLVPVRKKPRPPASTLPPRGPAPRPAPPPPLAPEPVAQGPRATVAGAVRELVLAGLSNAEVLVELAHRFPRLHLEPGGRHRSYAGWYRRYWARRGVVAPGTAPARKPKRRKAPAR